MFERLPEVSEKIFFFSQTGKIDHDDSAVLTCVGDLPDRRPSTRSPATHSLSRDPDNYPIYEFLILAFLTRKSKSPFLHFSLSLSLSDFRRHILIRTHFKQCHSRRRALAVTSHSPGPRPSIWFPSRCRNRWDRQSPGERVPSLRPRSTIPGVGPRSRTAHVRC